MIAIVNSILTFGAIHLLGIQNAAFLCFIVFLCSFIPVLGVVFSSVPIAVMALTQEGGSFMLAVWSIVAILLIHFLETSVLNPRILGNMLHLHPVLVLAILAICEHFFGVWGLLLGVPVFVYIIRFVILQEGIPGFIEMPRSISSQQDKK
jgi:predicted PurR-regulated permease PerM